jgi:hypothetical protein
MRCVHQNSSCYLAEVYAPRGDVEARRAEVERVRAAATALAAKGVRVRHVHSVLVPGEETAFHLLTAEGRAAVERVLRDAGLGAERISPAVEIAGNGRGEAAPAGGNSSSGLPGR